jgi:transposase
MSAMDVGAAEAPTIREELSMQAITTIGFDIAKSVFQVHGVDAAGQVAIRRQMKRRYVLAFFQKLRPCLVGIEACASSHYWSRELQALGHTRHHRQRKPASFTREKSQSRAQDDSPSLSPHS